MPKETIKGTLFDNSAVYVSWGKSDIAQLGVTLGGGFVFVDKDGNTIYEEVPVTTDSKPVVYDSLWFTFENRDQINGLIRNLRKARDAVFGKDE